MGGRASHSRDIRVAPITVSSNETVTHAVVQFMNSEKSIQTSIINLRTDIPVESPPTTQDTAVQTSSLNLRITTSSADGTEIKLLPEIKLNLDRTRTIGEDHPKNPRKDLISNKEYRQHIDNNCSNVKSIVELVKKIESYSENDLVRAWCTFYWIAKNITCASGRTDHAADVVFRSRTGASQGFTNLFSECCRQLDIECIDVHGHAKENSFRIGDTLQQATHAWNAVKLSGRWYLLDTTWGASNAKEKKFDEFYFLTSPDQMIYTHLPNEDVWQLLSPPITKQEFLDLPLVKSAYYRLNLKLISPKQCIIETNQPLFEVVVKAPSDVTLSTSMKVKDDKCPDYYQFSQYDHTNDMTHCYFSPKNDGTYDLVIYGKTDKETTYADAIHMRLKVIGLLNAPTFPVMYRAFTENHCTLIEPFRRFLQMGEHVTIQMRIPNATSVRIHNGNEKMSAFGYENEMLVKEVVVEGDVIVTGIFDRTEQYQQICKFNMA